MKSPAKPARGRRAAIQSHDPAPEPVSVQPVNAVALKEPEIITNPALHVKAEAMDRAKVLDIIGFTYQTDARLARIRTRQALSAVTPEKRRVRTLPDGEREETIEHGGAPDWPVRLKAADMMLGRLAGLHDRPHPEDQAGDPSRPLAVNIIVQGQPASQGQDVAVRVALDG